ncbi:MAG: hypothetical protein EBT92_08105 [Planctomycetes bacterium]|nr:hypothetical protein [Planctomycetota bacterium]NBY01993.1 hypothetical protein [Planctomycetota bacterium]
MTGIEAREAKPIMGLIWSMLRRIFGVPVLFLGLCHFPTFAMRFLIGLEQPQIGDVLLIIINLLAMIIFFYVGFCWIHGQVARFSLPPRMTCAP